MNADDFVLLSQEQKKTLSDLLEYHYDKREVAELLQVTRMTLWRKLNGKGDFSRSELALLYCALDMPEQLHFVYHTGPAELFMYAEKLVKERLPKYNARTMTTLDEKIGAFRDRYLQASPRERDELLEKLEKIV